jgi:transcriptional regulator with XRE-family HTH domain
MTAETHPPKKPLMKGPSTISGFENVDFRRLSELIYKIMDEKSITLEDLSKTTGKPQNFIKMYISGFRRNFGHTLKQITEILEIPVDEIPRISEPTKTASGKNVFISYSHKDKEFLSRLMVHLKPLEKSGVIDSWVDTKLLAGDKWKKEIEKALKGARVAILLISADFLASSFIVDNELPPLLKAAEESGVLIIPVILKPCRFARDPNLNEFQAINTPDDPIALMDEVERESIYDSISLRIEMELIKK